MAGTKKPTAHQFIDLALSKDIQSELVKSLRAGPTNTGAIVLARSAASPASSRRRPSGRSAATS